MLQPSIQLVYRGKMGANRARRRTVAIRQFDGDLRLLADVSSAKG